MKKTKKAAIVVVTQDEAWERIQRAASRGQHEVKFDGEVIEKLEFRRQHIPVSLSLVGTTINGPVNFVDGTFAGAYIDLDGTKLKGHLCLSGLKPNRQDGAAYSLYLRRASVWGGIYLGHTRINWLCIGGLRVGWGRKPRHIKMCDTEILLGISLESES